MTTSTSANTSATPRIPVAVITGFLGAGKTTLINRILSEHHGLKIAVIKNEIGAISIDAGLLEGAGTIRELDNGCLCCSAHGELIKILRDLAARRDDFDYLVIETTGVANPGPVINTFRSDKALAEVFNIDSVVCVVDAKHLHLHIDEVEVQEQLALADIVLLNKIDLVVTEIGAIDVHALATVEARIKAINGLAAIHRTSNSVIGFNQILDTGRFSTLHLPTTHSGHGHDHDHDHGHDHGHDHHHDHEGCHHDHEHCQHGHNHNHADGHEHADCDHAHGQCNLGDHNHEAHLNHAQHSLTIQTVGIEVHGTLDKNAFNNWLRQLIRTKGNDIFRMKGIVSVEGNPARVVFHAVHLVSDFTRGEPWGDGKRECKVVFIGRHLNESEIRAGFLACLTKA